MDGEGDGLQGMFKRERTKKGNRESGCPFPKDSWKRASRNNSGGIIDE